MAQPRIRNRRKPPAPTLQIMDLLGVGRDGNLYLWQPAGQVQPITRFEWDGGHVLAGHYVIEHNGKAVTVHCSNLADGRVGVQYMCGGLPNVYADAKVIEPLLLGRVIPDPVAAAEISRMLQELIEDQRNRQTAPHRRRGRL